MTVVMPEDTVEVAEHLLREVDMLQVRGVTEAETVGMVEGAVVEGAISPVGSQTHTRSKMTGRTRWRT
jgi:hypothetical protein